MCRGVVRDLALLPDDEGQVGLYDTARARRVAAGEIVREGQGPVTVQAAHPVAWPSSGADCSARYTDALLTPRTLAMLLTS